MFKKLLVDLAIQRKTPVKKTGTSIIIPYHNINPIVLTRAAIIKEVSEWTAGSNEIRSKYKNHKTGTTKFNTKTKFQIFILEGLFITNS